MTSMQDLSAVNDALGIAFDASGLTLEPADGLADLPSSLSTVTFVDGSDTTTTPATLAVLTDAGLDIFDAAVAALQKSIPGLIPGEATAVDSVAELDIHRTGIVTYHTILSEGALVGLLILEEDRRRMDGADPAAASTSLLDEPAMSFESDSAAPSPGPSEFTASTGASVVGGNPIGGGGNLTMLSDVVLNVTVELGRQSLTLAQVLGLSVGSVVELDRTAGAPVDIRVNGILFGRGEVVVVDDEYAVRIIEILETPAS
jgi:flagellar motor switch protein FliN/FliY